MCYPIAIQNWIIKEKWIHSLELTSKIEFKFLVQFYTKENVLFCTAEYKEY